MIDPIGFAVLAFSAAAICTVGFGIRMTYLADEIAVRTGLHRAVVGALFLGALTSIAEVTTSLTAAVTQHPELAVNNAMGSIVAQTAFIAVADLAYRRANLEHAAADVSNLMLLALFLGLNGLLLVATTTPELAADHFHPISAVIVLTYLYGMRLVALSGEVPMWQPRKTSVTGDKEQKEFEYQGSKFFLWSKFIAVGAALGVSGSALAHTGIRVAELSGLSETFVGALMTGVTSSMPELVTAVTAVRLGSVTLALSNIIGGNAFDAVIVALSDFAYVADSIYIKGGEHIEMTLAVAMLMNVLVLLALLRRERHGIANIGLEGVLLLFIYLGFVYLIV